MLHSPAMHPSPSGESNPSPSGHDDAAAERSKGAGANAGGHWSTPKKRRIGWMRWVLLVLAFLGVSVWLVRGKIAAWVEKEVVTQLAGRGIYLHYSLRTWSLWHGLHLEHVVLDREATGNQPVIEVSSLNVRLPLLEMLVRRGFISHWHIKDGTLTLHDSTGAITFEHVTTKVVVRPGEVDVEKIAARRGALALALSGKVLLAPRPEKPNTAMAPFFLDLSVLRTSLDVLAFSPQAQPFTIEGSYSVDLRDSNTTTWQANLSGQGHNVEWQGIPVTNAGISAEVSSKGMKADARLQLNTGSTNVSFSTADWDTAPLRISGTLADAAGQTDEFSATYAGDSQLLSVSDLHGKANLLEFAHSFPALAPFLPARLRIEKFPDLAVKDLAWSFAPQGPSLSSIGSVEVRTPASLAVTMGGESGKIDGLTGSASYLEKKWKVEGQAQSTAWGAFKAQESRVDITLAASRLQGNMALQLAHGSIALKGSADGWPSGPVQFTGSLTDADRQSDRIEGSYHPGTNTLRLAELSGKANLVEFLTNLPGRAAVLPAGTRIRVFPEIAVRDFTYRPGKSPTIGSLRFVSPADVTVTFRGEPLAIDHLTGQLAFDGETWRLSHLGGQSFGGQWQIDGAYSNGTLRQAEITAAKVKVAQLKPWLGDSEESIGEAILALDYRGAIGAVPSAVTGNGSLHLTNAPLVKVPLLDQTYALFSALISPVQRRGDGQLDTTFAVTNGVAKVSQFSATGDALKVTATGTVDFNQRKVDALAHANFRGIVGVATSLLSRTLEMEVSGPLDNVRVRPVGVGGMAEGAVTGAAKIVPRTVKEAGDLLKDGVALPARMFNFFRPEPPAAPKK